MPVFTLPKTYKAYSEKEWKSWISRLRYRPCKKSELLSVSDVLSLGVNIEDEKLWRFDFAAEVRELDIEEWLECLECDDIAKDSYFYPLEVLRRVKVPRV